MRRDKKKWTTRTEEQSLDDLLVELSLHVQEVGNRLGRGDFRLRLAHHEQGRDGYSVPGPRAWHAYFVDTTNAFGIAPRPREALFAGREKFDAYVAEVTAAREKNELATMKAKIMETMLKLPAHEKNCTCLSCKFKRDCETPAKPKIYKGGFVPEIGKHQVALTAERIRSLSIESRRLLDDGCHVTGQRMNFDGDITLLQMLCGCPCDLCADLRGRGIIKP